MTPPADAVSTWKVRALGGALGALTSAAVLGALLLASWATAGGLLIVAIVAATGIPVGVVVGWAAAPGLVNNRQVASRVLVATLWATTLGIVGFGLVAALGEGRGASILDIIAFALPMMLFYGIYGGVIGLPMAAVVAAVATWLLRRLVARVRWLWVPSLLVCVGIAVAGLVGLGITISGAGDQAAANGDRVTFNYRVVNESSKDLSLEIRSYWAGNVSGGASSGWIGTCTSGNDSVQGSSWAIWIIDANDEWHDRPPGSPVVSSATYGAGVPVDLTIVIRADGAFDVLPGSSGGDFDC